MFLFLHIVIFKKSHFTFFVKMLTKTHIYKIVLFVKSVFKTFSQFFVFYLISAIDSAISLVIETCLKILSFCSLELGKQKIKTHPVSK